MEANKRSQGSELYDPISFSILSNIIPHKEKPVYTLGCY